MFVVSDPVLDGFIDYGDVIFSKAEPDKRDISWTTRVRGRLMELLGSCSEARSHQTGVRGRIITCRPPDEQRNSGNVLFTLRVQ